LILAGILVTLAALIKKVDPRRRKRIRRASILYMLYLTTFVFAAILGSVHAEGWAWRVWFLADLFEVLVIIDFVAILLFDLVLLSSGQQGCISAIRWRHTVVETRNWDTIIVPNSVLLGENIVILGQRQDQPVQHRMWVYFNVDFRYSPEEVIHTVDDALQSTP